MTDTRCANPEYQLDVDVMVIEYTVFKAVEARMDLLRYDINHLDHDDKGDSTSARLEKQAVSDQLNESFDILLNLFHINHPTTDLSSGCTYNIKILEFLTLLTYWLPRTALTYLSFGKIYKSSHQIETLPQALVAKFEHDKAVNMVLRQNWLSCQYCKDTNIIYELPTPDNDVNGQAGQSMDLYSESQLQRFKRMLEPREEAAILKQWNQRVQAAATRQRAAAGVQEIRGFSLNLTELIPQFMNLSACMAQAMGCVSEVWFDLTARFMYYAALERLRMLSQVVKGADEDEVTILIELGDPSWIAECFAWGSVRAPSRTDTSLIHEALRGQGFDEAEERLRERLRTEDIICAMFNRGIEIQAEDEEILERLSLFGNNIAIMSERKPWTEMRAKWRRTFFDLYLDQAKVSLRELQSKEQSYPIQSFLLDLLHSVEGLWSCNISPDISGKPILVQIEEGGLEGMEQQDFEGLLQRVGLRSSTKESTNGSGSFHVRWIR